MKRLKAKRKPGRESLAASTSGASLVEFALILPVFLLFLIGSLEVGYRVYAKAVVNGALREVARMASTGAFTGAQIDQRVLTSIQRFRADADIDIVKKSYTDFTGVNLPEPIISGTIESGEYCFQDINNNTSWDEDRGVDGLGGPEDVIYYEVTMTYPTLFDFSENVIGFTPNTTISLNTLVSNEPFAPVNRTPPPILCVG